MREQVQTKLKQVDKNGFETAKNYSKLIRRASEIEGLGLLESEGGPFKIIDFHWIRAAWGSWGGGMGGGPPKIIDFHSKLAALGARFWDPFWNPFRFMMPSRVALYGKLAILGGSSCRVFFWRDFVSFWNGFWPVKTLILHKRGSKNHNFTEVRIQSLFGSILVVILHQNLPKTALGLAMGRPEWPSEPIFGGPKTDPPKSIK